MRYFVRRGAFLRARSTVFADEIARSRDLVVEHQGIFAEIVDRVRSVMHFMFLYVEL